MYQRNYHSDIHWLSTQQHVSLDKHQQMIDSALRWQEHLLQAKNKQETASITRLHPIFATLLHIFAR